MMKLPTLLARTAAVAALLTLPVMAGAQNLVTNGGFEADLYNSPPAGWTLTNCGIASYPLSDAPEGQAAAGTGCFQNSPAGMAQTLATTIGYTYQVDFFGGCSTGACFSDYIQVFFDGNNIFSSSMAPGVTYNSADGISWGHYSIMTGPATSTSSVIEFRLANDPAGEYLDDVQVTAAVPEPASLVLLATGLFGIGAVARRKRIA